MLRKRPEFGPSADSRVYLSVALQGPPPVIFPFTLPASSVRVAPPSLTRNTAMLRQTAATRKSSCSTIHRRSSLGLSGYPSRWAPPGSSDSPLHDHRSAKKCSTTIAPNFSFARPWRSCFLTLSLSATSSATQVHTALAPSGITIARSSGVAIARSKGIGIAHSVWHRDRSLRLGVALQSLAVFDFRRLHGSNPHDFSSPKLHLGMGEEFPVKQQSELSKNFGRRLSPFGLRRRSKWENDWGRTLKRNGQVYAAIGRRAKFGSFAKRATAN